MDILATLGVIFLLSFLVESLVEYIAGQLFKHIPAISSYSWVTMYIALAVGIAGAFVYGFDLLALLGTYLGASIQSSSFGIVLTGAAIGRGSNYLHDLVSRYFTKTTTTQTASASKAAANVTITGMWPDD